MDIKDKGQQAISSAAGAGVVDGEGNQHVASSYVRLGKKRKNHYPAWYTKRSKMLSKRQKLALKDLWPRIGKSEQSKTLKYGVEVDLEEWFGSRVRWGGVDDSNDSVRVEESNSRRWIDIGFGTGTSLIELAEAHPSDSFLGVEIFRAGNAWVSVSIETQGTLCAR